MDGKNRHFLIIHNQEKENIKINLFYLIIKLINDFVHLKKGGLYPESKKEKVSLTQNAH
jgi:hypothetical protein